MFRPHAPLFSKISICFIGLLAMGGVVYGYLFKESIPWLKSEPPLFEKFSSPKLGGGQRGDPRWNQEETNTSKNSILGNKSDRFKSGNLKEVSKGTTTESTNTGKGSFLPVLPRGSRNFAKLREAEGPKQKEEKIPTPLETGVMARFDEDQLTEQRRKNVRESLPEAPSKEEIARILSSIHGLIQRCYDQSMVPGEVDLSLVVEGQTGRVIRAMVSEESSTAICIRRIARTLRFPLFARESIVISHPYLFR